ncbi:hypothetical protein PC9H_004140 [Pleurotus ostreatus]|uniref:Signal recognition particle subunit SRP68 n=1 Tax=Pleurotus ostreatus TaxID=5322 RepID=A0A8H7DYN1_PLEOS|nr:uncharacterized protein PC9H_004140 [Pleurotus ostreatus]KAF7437301.1 hypothetical protein PC9H_004140 [Pleurotus ostreatus]KAJ8703197.1 signal recognition particle subunit srp68 [Pleurotus ostreatus]
MANIKLRVLQLANEQRSAYGLRYNDYERYRKHCANRTHRLRSSLKMTHGKGREFKKLPEVPTENLKAGHLELLLFEAERAWSYSQELLALVPKKPDAARGLKQTAKGRFRRAVNWATQLLSRCQTLYASGALSAESFLEVHIYVLILNGRWLRQRYELDDALIQLSVAKSLLDELAATAPTSRDQALAVLFADEISPEIRYCAHELGRAKAYDIEGIVSEFAPKHKNELVEDCDKLLERLKEEASSAGVHETSRKLKPLFWEGTPVPIRNPELVDVLLKVQDAQARLEGEPATSEGTDEKGKRKESKASSSKKGVAAYDAILHALSDAEEVARKLVEAQQSSGTSSSTVGTSRDTHFVQAYIVYQLLSRRIQRDLLLTSSLLASHTTSRKPPLTTLRTSEQVDGRLYPAVIKLYDTVLQSLGQMRTLSIVDDNPDLSSAVEARISFTKGQRCFYLAKCYIPVKKYAEALVLSQKANIHLREARSTLSIIGTDPINTGSPAFYPLTNDECGKLEADLAADALRFKKEWFAYNGGSVKASNAGFKKPLFFDIALNYVELDMDKLQERAGKAPRPPVPIAAPLPVSAKATEPIGKKSQAAKVVEEARPATPEPTQQPARGGLSNLLGGWWGRS